LIGIGIALIVVGAFAWTGWLSWFGRLPGDIRISGERGRVYIPITSMVLASVGLTILLSVFRRR